MGRNDKMPKKWRCRIEIVISRSGAFNPEMGFCYAVKIPVLQGFYLVKIGATSMPKARLSNIGRKGTIFLFVTTAFEFLGE